MALKLYDKIVPSDEFALVDAEHVEMADGSNLSGFATRAAEQAQDLTERVTALEQRTSVGAEVILARQEDLVFTPFAAFGCYGVMLSGMLTRPLSGGEEYTVVWDEVEYTRTAVAFTNPNDGTECVAVGNPMVYGQADNGDTFAVVCDLTNGYVYALSTETKASHDVEICCTAEVSLAERVEALNERFGALETPAVSVDLTAFESSGTIVETHADGSVKTYTMEFDGNGNPTKVTDSNGNVTVLTW